MIFTNEDPRTSTLVSDKIILELLKKNAREKVVVYCFSKKKSEELSNFINQNLNEQSVYYH